MPNKLPTMPATPELFTLRKMQPNEVTNSESLVFCEGHFFPTTLDGITVKDYGQPIYELIEANKETGKAA